MMIKAEKKMDENPRKRKRSLSSQGVGIKTKCRKVSLAKNLPPVPLIKLKYNQKDLRSIVIQRAPRKNYKYILNQYKLIDNHYILNMDQ